MKTKKKEGMFDSFCTPSWAATLVYGHVTEFTDSDLSCMKLFIDDEIVRRQKQEVAA